MTPKIYCQSFFVNNEIFFKNSVIDYINYDRVKNSKTCKFKKSFIIQNGFVLSQIIELREHSFDEFIFLYYIMRSMLVESLVIQVPIKRCVNHQRPGRKQYVIIRNIVIFETCLTRKTIPKSSNELWERKQHILIEKIKNHPTDSPVILSPMTKYQFLKIIEFRYGKVTGKLSTIAFFS